MPQTRKRKERFPLSLHKTHSLWYRTFTLPNGKRRMVYFSDDKDASLEQYLREREDWQAGRNPREAAGKAATVATLSDLVNLFLSQQKARVESKEISPVTFGEYLQVGRLMVENFGRNRDPSTMGLIDFIEFRTALAARYAPSRLSKSVVVCRMIFNWGIEADLLPPL
ncbi:MAG: hypothetical protein ACK5Q5_09905, partial [Planctomycetaceae bacterium]